MNSFVKNPTFLIKTLGCKVNQYETQVMRESLLKSGFIEKKRDDTADFYIINSCTVTDKADKETRNLARRFYRVNPRGKIAIAGCYVELDNDRHSLFEIPGVTHLIRNNEKQKIAEILRGSQAVKSNPDAGALITSFKDRDRAFIKIQDGCDHRCAYCKVNLVRGRSKSRPPGDIIKESELLIGNGFKEIVLTGICLGAWTGVSNGRKNKLTDLINKISDIHELFRIRLSSIEPVYVTDRLIETMKKNEKVCKHLHIPLQSGDDKILRLMKRPYTLARFKNIVKKLRKHIPDAAVTTDVLLGFPGEDKKSFLKTAQFLKTIKPSRMHIFSYSKRDGTDAASYVQKTKKDEIKNRAKMISGLNSEFSMDFAEKFVGKTESTIIESQRDEATGCLAGYTDRYVRVLVTGQDSLKNTLVPVKITHVDKAKKVVFGHSDPST